MKIYIETYGCSANLNDSEIMAGILTKDGHTMVKSVEEADAVVVNTCTVKGPTENKIKRQLRLLQENYSDKKLVVAGCMAEAQTAMVRELFPKAAIVGTHKIQEVGRVVNGELSVAVGRSEQYKVELPKVSFNNLVSVIQINEGCFGHCSFCITKLARGDTLSYPIGLIRNAVEESVQKACKEIWLTSQDTGAYGLDRRSNLPQLLQEICSIDKDFFIRVGMMNPTLANYLLEPLITAYNNDKVFKFLHIPVQAGSDKVLRDMKRGYTVAQFKKIVASFRKQLPKITISTDIICGFPTETEADFEQTLQLVEEIRPDIINISRYWPRPGTESAQLKQLPGEAVKERSTNLAQLHKKIAAEKNKEWIGWRGRVLVDEIGKDGTVIGRNFAYKPVIIKGGEQLLGKFVEVEVISATSQDLRAELL